MLTKENLIDVDCKHVFRAVNIKFNDQLMTRVKGIKNNIWEVSQRFFNEVFEIDFMIILISYPSRYVIK